MKWIGKSDSKVWIGGEGKLWGN